MKATIQITASYESNDSIYDVTEIHVMKKQSVLAGHVLVVAETEKSAIEIVTPVAGVIKSTQVNVGDTADSTTTHIELEVEQKAIENNCVSDICIDNT